jgi:hypothetical protein
VRALRAVEQEDRAAVFVRRCRCPDTEITVRAALAIQPGDELVDAFLVFGVEPARHRANRSSFDAGLVPDCAAGYYS